MATSKEILAIARGEVGYHEQSGKRTKYGAWYGLQGEPWCMEFVQWVYHTAGADLPYKTPSCGTLLRWYQANHPECVVKDPIPGCIIIFDWPKTKYSTDHTGIFVSKTNTSITSIDGNTSNESEGNGGWVQERTRTLSYANPVYIIPRELEEDAIVKRYNTLDEINKECSWALPTITKLVKKNFLSGTGAGFDLSLDMIRLLVINDRAGLYD